jgi:hypothetical protein
MFFYIDIDGKLSSITKMSEVKNILLLSAGCGDRLTSFYQCMDISSIDFLRICIPDD